MHSVLAFLTRDEWVNVGVTFFSILLSILISIPGALYIDRLIRRHKTGEDFEYGLHLLRVLKELEGKFKNGKDEFKGKGEEHAKWNELFKWNNVIELTTDQINAATVDSDYKPENKKHRVQLEKVCHQLAKRGALKTSKARGHPDDLATKENPPDSDWFKSHFFEISNLGKKVITRALRREAFDERLAVFELYYRTGILPSTIKGEEHGRRHREYLEYLFSDRANKGNIRDNEGNIEGEYIVRDDDQERTAFLIRVGVSNFPSEFRYVEFTSAADFKIESDSIKIAEAVDKAWPLEGLASSKNDAIEILRKTKHELHHIHKLYQNAIESALTDIIDKWPGSGTPGDHKIDRNTEDIVRKFLGEADKDSEEDLVKLEDDLLKLHSEVYKSQIQQIIASQEDTTKDKVSKLRDLVKEGTAYKLGPFKLPRKIKKEDLNPEACIVIIPKEI